MSREEIEKAFIRRLRYRFWLAAVSCFGILAAVSIWIWHVYDSGDYRKEFAEESYVSEEMRKLMEEIDSLPIAGGRTYQLERIQAELEKLSDKTKTQLLKKRCEKVSEAVKLREMQEAAKSSIIVEDKSRNQYHMEFPAEGEAVLRRYRGKAAFEGKAEVRGEEEKFHELFSGNHSFTIEAVVNPRDTGYYNRLEPDDLANYNMIVSKGDHCAGLRISEQSVQFFIRSEKERWVNVKTELSEQQLDSWIHVAGVYDGESISVYLEGEGMHTIPNAGAVVRSEYPFTIGYCPETGRGSTCSIAKLRVYSRALTEEELNEGSCMPEDAAAELWYDFGDYQCQEVDLSPGGIRSYTSVLQMEEEQTGQLFAEPVPFYAVGDVVYSTDSQETADVSEDGRVTGAARGKASITASIEDTDVAVDIPVWVGEKMLTPGTLLEWAAQRLLLLDAVIFTAILFILAAIQRRQMISYAAGISEAVGWLGTEEAPDLTAVPNEVRPLFHEAEERFRQKDHKVREAEQRKIDLIAYLAHDLKTPIASIAGYLTLLKDGQQFPQEIYRHYVEIALGSSQRLNELIDEFFEISRFNMSRIKLEYQEINLTWFLEQLVSEFEPLFAKKRLSCRMEVPRNLHLQCDPDKLERVFNNLLRNAINYSYPDTEILLHVEAGEEMTFICENSGAAIDEEKLERIFEQFYRLETSEASDTGGTGLGLAIAKHIVELHKGKIEAQSRENRTRFIVTLPWQEGEEKL